MCQSDWCKYMFGDAFLTCANHFRACKPPKQPVLSGNICGQHSEMWLWYSIFWVKVFKNSLIWWFNTDRWYCTSWMFKILWLDDYFWCFALVLPYKTEGGYVMVLKFFSGFSTWNWPFSIIFLKYRYRLLGETKGKFLF